MASSEEIKNFFSVFREIIRSVYSSKNLQEVLDSVVTKTAETLAAKGALLRILNEETRLFEVRAAYGLGERYLSKGPVSTKKILSTTIDLHKVDIITDFWNASRVEYPQEKYDENIHMMLDVPLAIQDELRGLLRIYLTDHRTFSDEELDFMVTLAEQCACIIERVRLTENQQAHITHLATHMEKLSSLGRMAAGIAHEINNPLGGILLFSSSMSKKVEPGSYLEKGLEIIIRETQRCKTIIQGLLEFSRDQKPKKTLVDINEIIEASLGVVENEFLLHRVFVEKEQASDIPKTLLDKNQIEQVLINLLLNAIHAVEEHGMVWIKSDWNTEKGCLRVEVADDGCGISADRVEKIFEPFYTTRAEGTGLGLAVSYGIIENHRGSIQVFSELGAGSRFVIELPILDVSFEGKDSHENA